eukprot:jgi/Phyca11/572766/estExt2_Genewise1.C_PHYCAscaffold_490255
MAVRDRAFRRDIAPESELLEVYQVERQLQQQALLSALNTTDGRRKEGESSASKHDVDVLQRRVVGLEQDVANLCLRHELLLETAPRLMFPAVQENMATDSMANTIQKQKQQIIELEEALALETDKSAKMEQQCHRYEEVEKILVEFKRR